MEFNIGKCYVTSGTLSLPLRAPWSYRRNSKLYKISRGAPKLE